MCILFIYCCKHVRLTLCIINFYSLTYLQNTEELAWYCGTGPPYLWSHGVGCIWLSATEADIGKDLQEARTLLLLFYARNSSILWKSHYYLEVGHTLLKIPFKSRKISMDKAKIWFQIGLHHKSQFWGLPHAQTKGYRD